MPASIVLSGRYVAVLVALVVAAVAVVGAARLEVSRAMVTASLRAAVQLAAVSAIIVWVLRAWALTGAFVASMVVIASLTAGRRIGPGCRARYAALAITMGAAPTVALLLLSGVVPAKPISVVPIAGILIGGAMTATSLAGRRAMDTIRSRYGEIEAAQALGFSDRDAVLLLCRPSAAEALVPALDQTRTVGLVTLPGAFVGVLLGGASPVEAGAAQLLVLIGLLAVEAVAVVVVVELVARRLIAWPAR